MFSVDVQWLGNLMAPLNGLARTFLTGLMINLAFAEQTEAIAADSDLGATFAVHDVAPISLPRQNATAAPATIDRTQRSAMMKKACNEIFLTAKTYRLPRQFLLRLIWRESRFDPQAISPAGAQGIAQFMPATAQWRGLENPFDWSQSIQHSGRWLSELRQQFGNLGLAAAAYNAGPGRVRDWLAGTRELPDETRTYVLNVTGHKVDDWIALRDSDTIVDVDAECPASGSSSATALHTTPATQQPGAPGETKAKSSSPTTLKPRPGPWALQLIGDRSKSIAIAQYANLRQKFPTILGTRAPEIVARRVGGRLPAFWYQIRVSEASHQRATTLCTRLKSAGGQCLVIPN